MAKSPTKDKKLDLRVTTELKESVDAAAKRLKMKSSALCIEILQQAIQQLEQGKTLENLFAEAPKKSTRENASTPKSAPTKKSSLTKTEALALGSSSATIVVRAESGAKPSDILKAQQKIQDAGDNARIVFDDGEYDEDPTKNREIIELLQGVHAA